MCPSTGEIYMYREILRTTRQSDGVYLVTAKDAEGIHTYKVERAEEYNEHDTLVTRWQVEVRRGQFWQFDDSTHTLREAKEYIRRGVAEPSLFLFE
tara:strand:+ start:1715 stop:2002 length:288 start_codon:yes stop_codon:yes gene_type:complete